MVTMLAGLPHSLWVASGLRGFSSFYVNKMKCDPCEGEGRSESRDPLSECGVFTHLMFLILIFSKTGTVLIYHKHQQGNWVPEILCHWPECNLTLSASQLCSSEQVLDGMKGTSAPRPASFSLSFLTTDGRGPATSHHCHHALPTVTAASSSPSFLKLFLVGCLVIAMRKLANPTCLTWPPWNQARPRTEGPAWNTWPLLGGKWWPWPCEEGSGHSLHATFS